MTVRTSDRAALIERVADWATARMKEARYAKGETVTVVIADDDGVHLHREEIGLIPE